MMLLEEADQIRLDHELSATVIGGPGQTTSSCLEAYSRTDAKVNGDLPSTTSVTGLGGPGCLHSEVTAGDN